MGGQRSEKAMREQVVSRITRIKEFIDSFDATKHSVASLKSRQEVLKDSFQQFCNFEDVTEYDKTGRTDVEEAYFNTMGKIETLREAASAVQNTSPSAPSVPTTNSAVKLPTVNLPTFDGNYDHWITFRDMFTSLIHNNPSIGTVEKFYYLKTSLSGEAASVLDNLDISASSYELSWSLLSNRYTSEVTKISKEMSSNLSVVEITPKVSTIERLQRFWEIEHITKPCRLTEEQQACEDNFNKTAYRDQAGRFVVTLPTKGDLSLLGSTQEIASRRLRQVTRRLSKEPLIKARYVDFMREYEELGHMKQIPDNYKPVSTVYHIPHHAVHKEDSTTTKLRVVFNASTKGPNGFSLNDLLLVGPVVQDDIISLLMRFRKHRYALTADITKMYRQILVNRDQHDLQRILWWDEEFQDQRQYWLTTLTYGTAPASFLATRCLVKLAEDEEKTLPLASRALKNDFYVDDLITGVDSIHDGLALQSEVIKALKNAGMEIRKWASNSPELLTTIPQEHREIASSIVFNEDKVIKTLGLSWCPQRDTFQFCVATCNSTEKITKRTILSGIAKLFDPLGLVAPVIIVAKILMQKIWQLGLDWDETLPNHLQTTWSDLRTQFKVLDSLRIPRRIIPTNDLNQLEIHGFCDASERAYGACIYMRSLSVDGSIASNLVFAKSRVAPIKQTTIPRLELCGALLLSELLEKVRKALNLNASRYSLWTDSTVVLGWLNTKAPLKIFVANRVTQILELTDVAHWHHVRSESNPADCLSRGASPLELKNYEAWWHGPTWLSRPTGEWPAQPKNLDVNGLELPEIRGNQVNAFVAISSNTDLLDRFSTLQRLLRVTCYCLRFIRNCQGAEPRITGPLTSKELHDALHLWVRLTQEKCFKAELTSLRRGHCVESKSKLSQLNPFLDETGLIRVGGRLSNAKLEREQKHPLVLPSNDVFTDLLAQNEHQRLLHAGPQALLSSLRNRFWPLRGKDLARKICHRCMKCFRASPRDITQLMGDLPQHRVEPARPFVHSGVDFCGPIWIKAGVHRKAKLVKSYIAVFVCFSTKAVHIELVSALTTEAFLAALRRFTARRGKPSHIYSDNATNFIGASNELKELRQLFLSSQHKASLNKFLIADGITWHFIPARSPHHGGLWEAAVKSCKHHLRRTVGNAALTFEELTTVLAQIEACLNSRPLTALTSDPSDLSPLTPGHFLVGSELTAILEPDLQHLRLNTLSRWQLLQRLTQQFWDRWHKDYLSSLQQRAKWKSPSPDVQVGTMVLMKENNVPPLRWRLARVTEIHPGLDGRVRVVTLRTSGGPAKRSIATICPLPIDGQ